MHLVDYSFENEYLKYSYMGFENILSLNIFVWFYMGDRYFGVYETKNLDVSINISKDNDISLNFESEDESCQYVGKCKNFSELIDFVEAISGLWGFGGVF